MCVVAKTHSQLHTKDIDKQREAEERKNQHEQDGNEVEDFSQDEI